jgi:competence protein ComEA
VSVASSQVSNKRADSVDPPIDESCAPVGSAKEQVSEDLSRAVFWLSRQDQLTVVVIAVVCFAILACIWVGNDLTDQSPVVEHPVSYRIDINEAGWIEISQLTGIGPKLAKRIVESRNTIGPFSSIDNLARVNGIGVKKIEANRHWLVVKKAPKDDLVQIHLQRSQVR